MTQTVFLAFVYAAEAMIAYIYLKRLFTAKFSASVTICGYFVLYAVLYGVSMVNSVALNVGGFFLGNLIWQFFFFQSSLLISFIHSGILTVLMTATEIIVNFLLQFFAKDYAAYTYNLTVFIALCVLSKILYFCAVQVCTHILRPRRNGGSDPKAFLLLACLPVVSSLVSVAVIYTGLTTKLETFTEILLAVSVVFLLAANILVLIVYDMIQNMHEENLAMQLAAVHDRADLEFYKMMQQSQADQRILIHDIKRHLSAISSLTEAGETDRVRQYIAEVEAHPGMQKMPRYCENNLLNVILARYSKVCAEENLAFSVDIRAKTLSTLNDFELTTIFDNLLANAAESAKASEKREIDVAVFARPEQNKDVISVVNSCDTPPKSDGNGVFRTNKSGEGHGYGLQSIQRVVHQKGGSFHAFYEDKKRKFYVIIEI